MNTKGFIYRKIDLRGLGDRIKALRGSESQEAFAEKFGVSQADISRLERGSVMNPSPELLFNICISFYPAVNFEWLLIGEGAQYLEKPPEVVVRHEDPKLMAIMKKLELIYKQGDFDVRARLRGTIEELYDEVSKPEERGQKKGA